MQGLAEAHLDKVETQFNELENKRKLVEEIFSAERREVRDTHIQLAAVIEDLDATHDGILRHGGEIDATIKNLHKTTDAMERLGLDSERVTKVDKDAWEEEEVNASHGKKEMFMAIELERVTALQEMTDKELASTRTESLAQEKKDNAELCRSISEHVELLRASQLPTQVDGDDTTGSILTGMKADRTNLIRCGSSLAAVAARVAELYARIDELEATISENDLAIVSS